MLNSNFLKYGSASLKGFAVIHMDGDFDSVMQLMQGQVTSDCNKLSEELGQLSSMCDEKGFILCNFDILLHKEMILVIIEEASKNIFLDEIKKFSPFYKVSPSAINVDLRGICRQPNACQNTHEHLILQSDVASVVIEIGPIKAQESTVEAINLSDWHLNRKILGDHTITADENGKYRPHELMQNLCRVSFNKGCFRGQEIIARMEYLGKSKKETRLISYQDTKEISDFEVIGETYEIKKLFFSSCLGKKEFFKSNS